MLAQYGVIDDVTAIWLGIARALRCRNAGFLFDDVFLVSEMNCTYYVDALLRHSFQVFFVIAPAFSCDLCR